MSASENQWQLTEPLDAVVFDCDGTLSELEGINELAASNGQLEAVANLTQVAMSDSGITESIYQQRLMLTQPTRQQVLQLAQDYYFRRALDVLAVIETYQALGKSLWVMSAGINPAVTTFAGLLGIKPQQVFAVDVYFDQEGHYVDYDHDSLLTHRNGKAEILEKIKQQYPRIGHIGDGMNDYHAHQHSSRFIGYGGAFFRERLAKQCQFYIQSASLLPMLPLTLTQHEATQLTSPWRNYYQQGVELIQNHAVLFNE